MTRNSPDKILARRSIDAHGCWNYTGKFTGRYAEASLSGRRVAVHRLSAFVHLGFDLDSPLNVLHRCDNTHCFNPEHLFIGTQMDNVLDAIQKGRAPQFKPATHCKRGHPFTTENTQYQAGGGGRWKRCRECHNAARRRRERP